MREIRASHITDTVARLCIEANRQLPQDVRSRICAAYADEPWPIAKEVLGRILEKRGHCRRTAAADLSGYWHGLRFC